MSAIDIPWGCLFDDEEAARRRKILREKLLRGEEVRVKPNGNILTRKKEKGEETAIIVPEGKLAAFHWYDNDPGLLKDEKAAMKQYFPQFKLDKLEDGRLYWHGKLEPNLQPGTKWYLQAIYEHNHPSNTSFGGSVKVYSIDPDLEEIQEEMTESIPHLLRDASGHIYLCTARMEDVKAGDEVTSAASSLAWAAKWIAAFELWLSGDISTAEFSGHSI